VTSWSAIGFPRRPIGGERLGEAPDLLGGHEERRVRHAERAEQPAVEKTAERHAAHRFDDPAGDISRQTVLPHGSGLPSQRDPGERLDLLGRRDTRPVDVLLGVELLEISVRGGRIDESGRVTQEVVHGDGPLSCHDRVGRLPGGIGALHEHLQLRQLGQIDADWIIQAQASVLDEHHDRHRRERLRHRVEPEDRVL
jgi:hypothetical protein